MSSRWEQKWWTFYYTITCSLAKGAGGKENIAHLPLRMRQTEKRRQKVSMMKHPYSSPSFFRALQGNLRFDLFLPRKKLRSLKLFINSGMCQLAIWPPQSETSSEVSKVTSRQTHVQDFIVVKCRGHHQSMMWNAVCSKLDDLPPSFSNTG